MPRSWGWVLLFVLVTGVFGRSLQNGFVWDDHEMVENNPHVSDIRGLPELFKNPLSLLTAHPNRDFLVYRPLQLTTYLIERSLGAETPALFRTTNLLIHVGIVTTLFFVLRTLGFSSVAAFLLTAPFSVHPAVASVVYNITARHESLLTLFYLLSVLIVVQGKSRYLFLSLALYACALLSKETAVLVCPALVTAFLALPRWEGSRKLRVSWLAAIALLILGYEIVAKKIGIRFNPAIFLFAPAAEEWWFVFFQNIGNMTLPFSPAGYREAATSIAPLSWFSVCLLAVLLIFAVRRARNKKLLWIGTLTGAPPLLLITTVGLITGVPQDHYLVLPTLGLVLVVASVVPTGAWSRIWIGTAVAILAVFSVFTFVLGYTWKNEMTYWSFARETNGESPRIHRNLWPLFEEEGDSQKVRFHCERALALSSATGRYRKIHLDSLHCLGALNYRAGETNQSLAYFEKLRALEPAQLQYWVMPLRVLDRERRCEQLDRIREQAILRFGEVHELEARNFDCLR
ncbi:MAG TPA: hypothetical protein VI895_03760 [Bdellovibrionota bacterium]|nr:hypothetical protein [Bdellovibrionota bacterium]